MSASQSDQDSENPSENIMDLFRERVLNMYNISLAGGDGFPKQLTKHTTKNIKMEQMNEDINEYNNEIEERTQK
ncbi:MAG: hypothetical protein JKX76_01000 [Colwellia sp.]|nr:hypothetical protein [Colwellia sp.]